MQMKSLETSALLVGLFLTARTLTPGSFKRLHLAASGTPEYIEYIDLALTPFCFLMRS